MNNALMPRTKIYEKDGVSIEYLTYDTMLKSRVQLLLRAAYEYPAPQEGYPDRKEVPTAVYVFYTAMPCIVGIKTVDVPPEWGRMLKAEVESPTWLNDPIADFKRMERFAPEDLLLQAYAGFKDTRETAYVAPPELQVPAPLPPEAFGLEGEAAQDMSNPTSAATDDGTPPMTPTSSAKPALPRLVRKQEAG